MDLNLLIVILIISLLVNAVFVIFILFINEKWYRLYNEIIENFYDDVIAIITDEEY